MKCTFIVQNKGYCLNEKDENRRRVSWQFFNCLCSLPQVLNDINDNLKFKRLCATSLCTNKAQRITVYFENKTGRNSSL